MTRPIPTAETTVPPAGAIALILLLALSAVFAAQWTMLAVGVMSLVVAMLFSLWAARTYARPAPTIWWVVTFVGFLLVASLTVSRLRSISLDAWVWWAMGATVMIVSASWARLSGYLRTVFVALAAVGVLSAITAFAVDGAWPPPRLGGLFFNANALGGYLLWPLFLFLPLVIKRWRARVTVPALMLIALTLALTLSVTSAAAAVIPLIVAAVWGWPRSGLGRRKTLGLVAVVVGILIVMSLFGRGTVSRLLPASSATFSAGQRQEFMASAIRMWRAKPWFGWGLDSFQRVMPRFTTQYNEQPRHVHNLYLQLLAETGVVGAAWWVILIVAIGRAGWRAMERTDDDMNRLLLRGLWLGWLAVTIHAGLDFAWYLPAVQLAWWLASGLFIGLAVGEHEGQPTRSVWRLAVVAVAIGWLLIGVKGTLAARFAFRADRAERHDNFSGAIANGRQSIRWHFQDTLASRLTVWYLVRREADDLSAATALVDSVLRANPEHYQFHYLRGRLLLASGNMAEAAAEFARARELEPQFHLEYTIDEIRTLIRLGRGAEARDVWRQAIARYARPTPNPYVNALLPALRRLETDLPPAS